METKEGILLPVVIQFNVVEQFKYLAVQILSRLEYVVMLLLILITNLLMIEMNASIERWISLPISIGRINILKMNILPK